MEIPFFYAKEEFCLFLKVINGIQLCQPSYGVYKSYNLWM